MEHNKVVMLVFEFPKFKEIQKSILPQDLHYEGYSDYPHITLLYGLNNDLDNKDIIKKIKNCTFKNVLLTEFSLFENDEYDVLKYDTNTVFLHDINDELIKLPHENDFPDYIPHLTIAYIKKGIGKYYRDSLNKKYQNIKVRPKRVIIGNDGDYENFNLVKK